MGRLAIALTACVSLLVLLGACDEGRPVNSRTTSDNKCLDTGGHCEFDNQCCSGRCYHETGCSGGRP